MQAQLWTQQVSTTCVEGAGADGLRRKQGCPSVDPQRGLQTLKKKSYSGDMIQCKATCQKIINYPAVPIIDLTKLLNPLTHISEI